MTDYYITGGMNASEYIKNGTIDKARMIAIKFLEKHPRIKTAYVSRVTDKGRDTISLGTVETYGIFIDRYGVDRSGEVYAWITENGAEYILHRNGTLGKRTN